MLINPQEKVMTGPRPVKTRRVGRAVRQGLGWIIAIACLIWVFHDVHPERLFRQMAEIRWSWVLIGVVFDILGYYCQGLRWSLLLKPVGRINSLRTTQAIYAGLFTNEVVPLRLGELVRAWLVARWLQARVVAIIPSVVVERLFDGIWLALGIGLTVLLVELPRDLSNAADILGVVVLAGTGIFLYLIYRREKAPREIPATGPRLLRTIRLAFDHVVRGIRGIGTLRHFYPALLVSSLVLIFQILAFWFVMRGYGLVMTFWVGAAVLFIEHLGTMVPQAPSNIGSYQFFTVLGLTLFGVDKTTASGFSVVVFIVLTLPLWVLGLAAVSLTGMKFRHIRAEVMGLMRKRAEISET